MIIFKIYVYLRCSLQKNFMFYERKLTKSDLDCLALITMAHKLSLFYVLVSKQPLKFVYSL